MKKLFTLLAGCAALLATAQKGNLKVGAHVGLPVGKAADFASVNAGADVAYLYRMSPMISAGITSGYSHYFGKDTEYRNTYWWYTDTGSYYNYGPSIYVSNNFGIIPLAGTFQVDLPYKLFAGGDVGYAFSTSKGGRGFFYYQPRAGYRLLSMLDVALSYKGLSRNGGSIGSINLGGFYNF